MLSSEAVRRSLFTSMPTVLKARVARLRFSARRTSPMIPRAIRALCLFLPLLGAGCAPKAPATAPSAPGPQAAPRDSWEQKLAWIMRLEDQRILREPNPPAPVVIRAATGAVPAVVAPPPPSDLLVLLDDAEARVRRRAAFALGLIGSPAARPPLLQALTGSDVVLQSRAAEALGLIGDKTDAPAIGDM